MLSYSRAALVVAVLALTVTACRQRPEVETPVPVVQTPQPAPNNNPPPPPPPPPPATTVDREAAIRTTTANLLLPLFFDYDAAELSLDARSNLDLKVRILRANTAVSIRIEGHADNRGSTEYNIALGQRRAAAARQYLIDHGIPATRIVTVSLGEERPSVMGENEAAWAKNRRDEFIITAGAITEPIDN